MGVASSQEHGFGRSLEHGFGRSPEHGFGHSLEQTDIGFGRSLEHGSAVGEQRRQAISMDSTARLRLFRSSTRLGLGRSVVGLGRSGLGRLQGTPDGQAFYEREQQDP